MTLTTIQYGSVASSEVINGNFTYLDGRITSSNESTSTSLSSIQSNIATINSRITQLSESVTSSLATLSATVETYRTKVKLLVKNSSMVPNWNSCTSISFTSGTNYTASSNGFVLVIPSASTSGNITVNTYNTIVLKYSDDLAAELITIPVKSGDRLSTTVTVQNAYFVPAAEISVENF